MKNNIKKAPVKFWEDLLYFQHNMQIFVFCSKLVIITTLKVKDSLSSLLVDSNHILARVVMTSRIRLMRQFRIKMADSD